jgi:hypothetical protein
MGIQGNSFLRTGEWKNPTGGFAFVPEIATLVPALLVSRIPLRSLLVGGIPVVVFGAPLGAYVVSQVPRLYTAALLYTVVAVQFGTALWVIQPAPPLLLFSAGIFGVGVLLFFQLPRWGPAAPTSS